MMGLFLLNHPVLKMQDAFKFPLIRLFTACSIPSITGFLKWLHILSEMEIVLLNSFPAPGIQYF